MRNIIHIFIFFLSAQLVIGQDYINFYPWISGSTTGTMTSDPQIGEFGAKSGCVTATTTIVNSGGAFQINNPQFTSTFGTTLGLRVGVDWTTASQTTTVTIDLKTSGNLIDLPVSFNLYDINAGACGTLASPISSLNKFIDVVSVVGYKRTNNTTVNTGTAYNPNSMTNVGSGNTISGNTITGSSSAGGSISSAVSFTTSICRIVITYRSGTGTPPGCTSVAPWPLLAADNPRAQEIAISPLLITYNCVLPVEFGVFNYTCNEDNIEFNWNTFSELNNMLFQIHSSLDGENFELINETLGSGTTQIPSYYAAIVEKRNSPITYYRLKQIDTDGEEEELALLSIPNNCYSDNQQYWFNPNPFNDELNIQWANTISSFAILRVTNLEGRLIYESILPHKNNSFHLETKTWGSGFYFIQIIDNEKTTTQQLIKQ
jgi:hypothetical protein